VRLRGATKRDIENVRISDDGQAINWPALDEDMRLSDLMYPQRVARIVRAERKRNKDKCSTGPR